MDGRGRFPPHVLSGRIPGLLHADAGSRSLLGNPLDVLPSVALLERKVASQHVEVERLLSENQRLATTHVVLRQDLAATQQELQRVQQAFIVLKNEKDEQVRALTEKLAKLETELRATEPIKAELENAKAGAHKLLAHRQELSNQITQITQELSRTRTEMPQVPAIKAEMEGLQQEMQLARTAFEYERKVNTELLEQRGAMETNLVSMAREVEKLYGELKVRVGAYRVPFGVSDAGYQSVLTYRDSYGLSKMPTSTDNGIPLGLGSASAWDAYDLQRASGLR